MDSGSFVTTMPNFCPTSLNMSPEAGGVEDDIDLVFIFLAYLTPKEAFQPVTWTLGTAVWRAIPSAIYSGIRSKRMRAMETTLEVAGCRDRTSIFPLET